MKTRKPGVKVPAALAPLTVRFDDATRQPSDTLPIGGLTITAFAGLYPGQGPARVATVRGLGLGADAVCPMSSVDRLDHYPAGQQYPDWTRGEGIYFKVAGRITAFTLVPGCSILETGVSLPLQFEVRYTGDSGQTFLRCDLSQPGPVTVDLTGYVQNPMKDLFIDITADFGETPYFDAYRRNHLAEEQTIRYGFTVQSLQYAPALAPLPPSGLRVG